MRTLWQTIQHPSRKSKVKALRKEENLEEEAEVHKEEFGYITVIENVFGFKTSTSVARRLSNDSG